ncbi:hypothetical protein [Feifania hominis]|uniref:Uncharacterized protein n=1 Tax=Feifania hominis TaxID=2763660 RepID=A0A926HR45_9FIRM|nr:hypothetical protein [Feifania hominis]MBC8537032.1 hypothetical protein [Feifania hominis]
MTAKQGLKLLINDTLRLLVDYYYTLPVLGTLLFLPPVMRTLARGRIDPGEPLRFAVGLGLYALVVGFTVMVALAKRSVRRERRERNVVVLTPAARRPAPAHTTGRSA